jgi:hypothetical protein
MDWNKLQHTLFAMDPTDPREDLAKLQAQANGGSPSVPQTPQPVVESVEVPQGSLPVDKNYSVDDFAALAGVTTATPRVATSVMESAPAPVVTDKDARIAQLEERVARLESLLEAKADAPKKSNPVAKHMNTYNKSSVVPDKKKDAKAGKVKHKSKQYESIKDELQARLREFEAIRK